MKKQRKHTKAVQKKVANKQVNLKPALTPAPKPLLAKALALYQAGDLNAAENTYQALLDSHPHDVEIMMILGILRLERNKLEASVQLFNKVITLNPNHAMAYLNLGNALTLRDNYADALACYDKFIALSANNTNAHNNRGFTLFKLKRYEEALASCERAIALNPQNADAYNTCAVAFRHLKRYEEALTSADKALALNPNYASAYNNRGLALHGLKRYKESLASYDKAIAIDPHFAMAYNNRGFALFNLRQYDAALASCEKAITLNPKLDMAHNNHGILMRHFERFDEALASHDKAITITPDYADAYWNKSLVLLSLGKFEEGWRLYEWRWKMSDADAREIRRFTKPVWLGKEPLAGKTILLHSEQGYGDAIQFCRYATLVEKLGAKVILELQPALVSVIAPAFPSMEVIGRGQPLPDFDYYCPLMSLPLALGTTVNTIPASTPYLHVPPEKKKIWQERLGQKKKMRIGLAWSGAPKHVNDHNRSMTLEVLKPLLALDYEFFSLQKEVRPDDATLLGNSKIVSHADKLIDFSDTAAFISEMDVILSVDTSVAHLAGALGKPVWLLLPYVSDYRWMLIREDSPWYPTAKLFRQKKAGEWKDVLDRVEKELLAFSSHAPLSPPPAPHAAPFAPLDPLLEKALQSYQAENLNEAESICRKLLATQPKNIFTLNLLGIICARKGDAQEGLKLLDKAIAIDPRYVEAYNNRAVIYGGLNQHEEMIKNYDAIIALSPDRADVYKDRGICLYNLKRFAEAVAAYDQAIAHNLNTAEVYTNKGIVLSDLKQYDEAIVSFDKAVAIAPLFAQAYNCRGIAWAALKRHDEAIADYNKAIALSPDLSFAYNNRGATFYALTRYNDAIKDYEKTIALNPGFDTAYNNRATALAAIRKYDEALASFDQAIALSPQAETYWNKSLVLLLLGKFEEGWKTYEWRWKRTSIDEKEVRNFTKPLWLGQESLKGKTILLHAEQGLGDALQFCRYVPMVKALGADVILEVHAPLAGLIAASVDSARVIARGELLPEFDFYCPLMSLPLVFNTTLTTIPANTPYIFAQADRKRIWRERLGAKTKPRIGLVWSGATYHPNDHNRSIALRLLISLLDYDFDFFSFQKEIRSHDMAVLGNSRIIPIGDELKDFSDTAAAMEEMDLILSVDTSVVHLAGALGRPVWILLAYVFDFRWLTDRNDSPWYPAAKLFRQPSIGDWESVIATIKKELAIFFKCPEPTHAPASHSAPENLSPTVLVSKAVIAYHSENRAEAETLCREAIAAEPQNARALNLLGVISVQNGNAAEGLALLDRAISADPNNDEAHSNRAIIFYHQQRFDEALAGYNKAISINPKNAEAYNNRGLIEKNHLKDSPNALASFDKAIALNPNYAEAHHNRGLALQHMGRYQEALESYEKSLTIRPDNATVYYDKGIPLRNLNRQNEALDAYAKAFALNPNYFQAYNGRGSTLEELTRYEEALVAYDKAIAINPGYADAYWNKSMCKLMLADYEEGWKLYEWRWKKSDTTYQQIGNYNKPRWLGKESLKGKTILLHAEQGYGDSLQFCRYVPMVHALGAKIILGIQPPLANLFSASFPYTQVIVDGDAIPPFDFHSSLMSLPFAFGTTIETIPSEPYLSAQPEYVEKWKPILDEKLGKGKLRVGLCWAGGIRPDNPNAMRIDAIRSLKFSQLKPLFDCANAAFVSLQLGQPKDQLDDKRVLDISSDLKDWSDTAAVISLLDLVITVDTSVCHMVGALGKKFWLLNRYETCWRWFLNREDSPWYPTAKLFRQQKAGDWESVIRKMKDELVGFK